MTKLRVNQIIEAADHADIEDIELRRLIAEALLATDLDLFVIAAGAAQPTRVAHISCAPWRVRRTEHAPRRQWLLAAIATRYH